MQNEVMTESDGSTTQNGEKEVKGIELGLSGDITDKLECKQWNSTNEYWVFKCNFNKSRNES